jgi:hypothetical protein
MNKEQLESLLIDYIDGKLNSVDKHKVEQELMNNASSYRLYEELKTVIQTMAQSAPLEPAKRMRASFDDMLANEMANAPKAKVVLFTPAVYKVAAAVVFLVLSVGLLYVVNRYQDQQAELARIQGEHARLLAMIGDTYSPAQRILGVKAAFTSGASDEEFVSILIKTMDNDPNSNVRLAAVDGLSRFHENVRVRKALINSLVTQTDPIVQIALIQLMVSLKDKAALAPLHQIVGNDEVLPVVKDEAHIGIMKLS